jgi:hypothetical protein
VVRYLNLPLQVGSAHLCYRATAERHSDVKRVRVSESTPLGRLSHKLLTNLIARQRIADRLQRVADAYASVYEGHVTVRDGAFHDTEGGPDRRSPSL